MSEIIESIVLRGDLSGLSPADRARHYTQMCEGLGLNPHAQPFAFLKLNGKEVMYATRGATDQLAAIHKVTREMVDGPKLIDLAGTKLIYAVCRATHPNGRTETATATVPFVDPVNVLMKCETKAKRRATLSLLALSMLDETELESIPAGVQSPGSTVDLSAVEPAASMAARSAADAFEAELSEAKTLGAVIETWHSYARALHASDETQRATEAVGDWLGAHGYTVTATEQQHILARAWPVEALSLADELARLDDPAGVVNWPARVVSWYIERRAESEGLTNAEAFRTFVARTYCARASIETPRVVEPFLAAVSEMLPRPEALSSFLDELARIETAEEGLALWKKSRAALAVIDEELLRQLAWRKLVAAVERVGKMKNATAWLKKALAAEAPKTPPQGMPAAKPETQPAQGAPAPVVTTKGDVLDSDEKCSAYVREHINHAKHLESAARKYGSHPWMIGPLVLRASALLNLDTDSADVAVAKWAEEGPKTATETGVQS